MIFGYFDTFTELTTSKALASFEENLVLYAGLPRPRAGHKCAAAAAADWLGVPSLPILAHEATASAQYAQSTVLLSVTELLRVPAEGRAVKEGRDF